MPNQWTGTPRKRRSRKRFEEIPLCVSSTGRKNEGTYTHSYSTGSQICIATPSASAEKGPVACNPCEDSMGGDASLHPNRSSIHGVPNFGHPREARERRPSADDTHEVDRRLETWKGVHSDILTNRETYGGWETTQMTREEEEEDGTSPQAAQEAFSDEPEDRGLIQGIARDELGDSQRNESHHSSPSDCLLIARGVSERMHAKPPLAISNWRILWALFMTTGSRRLTKDQYQSVRVYSEACITTPNSTWKYGSDNNSNNSDKISVLPHYSTLQKTFKPFVLNSLAPRGQEMHGDVEMSKAGARFTSLSASGQPQTSLLITMPSEYARADVGSPLVWSVMRDNSLAALQERGAEYDSPQITCAQSCDILPVVAAREWFYGFPKSVHVDEANCEKPYSAFAEVGDTLIVSLINHVDFVEPVARCFSMDYTSQHFTSLRGIVVHTWTVHNATRSEDPNFREDYDYTVSPRDKAIACAFNFVQYRSPTDSVEVEVPNLPAEDSVDCASTFSDDCIADTAKRRKIITATMAEASRKRRAALKERKRQMEAAWTNWQTPILKPGDFAVLLRPWDLHRGTSANDGTMLTETDKKSRLCVVSRFWVEQEDRNRHIFWIPGDVEFQFNLSPSDLFIRQYCSPMGENSMKLCLGIRAVRLESKHDGKRGPEKFRPVSSVGTLDSGELYFVYRFVLFWDGFEVQAGKPASGDGVYMLCLNIPVQDRSSPNAIRVLSLTPPGMKTHAVLRLIMPDIIRGMTEGFRDLDAEGNPRRIFLDLVGVLGDTPALNSVLDILGHTAGACCHLCRYRRNSLTLLGSRYTGGVSHGDHSSTRRGFYQHAALHDCLASAETCRLLGVRANPNLMDMPLHLLHLEMRSVKPKIPTVSNGIPVVPCALDPYRACFIAPDHLLTGHLRDCISLAFKLLPSKKHREAAERIMMSCLTECGLRTQNRILDHEKKVLYSMSMTDIYALGSVAELSFLRGITETEASSATTESIDAKCRASIALVGSCSQLISLIWKKPEERRDGPLAVRTFEHRSGMSRISEIQHAVDAHISRVEDICKMDDRDFKRFESNSCSAPIKKQLAKLYKSCQISTRTADKPNVHRLREMAYTSLPMLGHVSLVGELVLEKTHQGLKRGLKQSNNRDRHIQAMKSILFDDWQGRMTLIIPGVFRMDSASIRGCFRLLAGREAIARLNGAFGEIENDYVIRALGPENCIRRELERQGRSVLAPRANDSGTLRWSLGGVVQQVHLQSHITMQSNSGFLSAILASFKSDIHHYTVLKSTEIKSVHSNGSAGYSFRHGDVVELLCCRPENPAFHYPFVVVSNSFSYLGSLPDKSASALWCIIDAVSLTDVNGNSKFYVTVRPCRAVFGPHEEGDLDCVLGFKRYMVDPSEKLFFARTDDSMFKVGTLHICTGENCIHEVARGSNMRSPCAKPVNGIPFYAMTRADGFPPRRG